MRKILTGVLMLLAISATAVSCNTQTGKAENSTQSDDDVKYTTIHLTKDEFLKKVADYENSPNDFKYLGNKPAIVDFYADWCAPCRKIAPYLEELAKEYGGKIVIYKINTDKEQELAKDFGIRSIPSLLFIPMNGTPQMAEGAMPKEEIKSAIESVLLKQQ